MSWGRYLRRRSWHAERARELEAYLEAESDEQRARGLAPLAARRAAERQLGNTNLVLEEIYVMNSVGWWEAAVRDLRLGVRLARRAPGFSLAAVALLALGIGASTAAFGVVDAALLRPLPYPQPDRIVVPLRPPPARAHLGYDFLQWGVNDFFDLAKNPAWAELAAFKPDEFNLSGRGEPVRLDGVRVSAGFWNALGVRPALGRTYTAAEDTPGHEHEVVLSDKVWRRQFGGDPGVLGQAIDLNGAPYTVVGVMPAGFDFPRQSGLPVSYSLAARTEVWVPLAPTPPLPLAPDELGMIGRLAPGYTLASAQAAMGSFTQARLQKYPRAKGWYQVKLRTLTRQEQAGRRRPLLLLLGAVLVLLLTACANVAGLQVARGLARTREFAVRAALGASRGRLARQVLAESLLLALAGGVAGVGLALAAVVELRRLAPPGLPRLQTFALSPVVLTVALGLSLLAGLLCGLAPAWAATRRSAAALPAGGERIAVGRSRLRQALLVGELALALVLVVAAGLLVRSFAVLLRTDPGFRPQRAASFELTLPASYAAGAPTVRFYHDVLQQLRRLPDVQGAGLAAVTPLSGPTNGTAIRIPGRTPDPRHPMIADYTIVSSGYFAAAGTPLLRGRDFDDSDTAASQPVAIISSTMAAQFWPGQDPVGRQVGPASPSLALLTIVGVAADVKRVSLQTPPNPEMYVLYNQNPWPTMQTMDVLVRARAGAGGLARELAAAVHRVDPQVPLARQTTLAALVQQSLASANFLMLLMLGFGILATLAAAIGLYSVIAFEVQRRSPELAIRLALGASPQAVRARVLRQGVGLASAGVALGLLAAWALSRTMATVLYGVAPTDRVTFGGAAGMLLAVALLASYLPARRAARLDPLRLLRSQ